MRTTTIFAQTHTRERTMSPTGLYLLFVCIHALVHLLTYLHIWLRAYKIGNISETVEDRAKTTINGLYIVVHWLSIAAKMYDLQWPLSQIQDYWFLKCRKMAKYSLVMTTTPCRVAGGIISIRPTYSCACALTYLLTQSNQCFGDWLVI